MWQVTLLRRGSMVLRAEKQHLLAPHVVVDNEGRHGVEGGVELGGGGFSGRVGEDDDDVVQTGVETVDKDFGQRHLVDEVAVDVDLEHFAMLGLHQDGGRGMVLGRGVVVMVFAAGLGREGGANQQEGDDEG